MKRDQSALTRRRTPARRASERLRDGLAAVGRLVVKDRMATFLLVAAVVLTIVFFSLLGAIKPASAGDEVALSTVTALARANQVTSATLLDEDSRVVVTTADGRTLWAAYPNSDAQTTSLMRVLSGSGTATVTVDQQSDKPIKTIVVQFLLPILLLVCLFALFMRLGADSGAGGIAAFSDYTGKPKRRRRGKDVGRVTFDDVAGAGEAIVELREIRDFLEDPSRYTKIGAAAPKGVLLVGPPGTGKTLLARAVAGEADAAFYSVSGSEFVESLVGVGAARVRDLFRKARKTAPSIVFIDELDAAGRKRGAGIGQGNDEREQTLNQILVEMDGFSGDAGIVVMGATNRPDILDPALLRPGRFDRQVVIDVPDVHGRFEILRLHALRRPIDPDADLVAIARLTPGFSGAELANVINEAALLAVREGLDTIDQPTLEEAIDRVVSGPAKKSHVLTLRERQVIAVHEASHAIVIRALGQAVMSQKLSIVARGRTLGTAASQHAERDRTVLQEGDLLRQLACLVAGAAGERIEFGTTSTAINDDLHAATTLARTMVTSFGMSPELGMVTIGEQSGEVFLGASLQELGSVGPATLELIDREVERLVGEAVERAAAILRRNWDAVHDTADALLEQETLSGLDLDVLLESVQPVAIDDARPS